MFIYSVRASTVKMVGLILLLAVALAVVVFMGPSGSVSALSTATGVDYSGIKSGEDRLAFINGFGIEVDKDSEAEEIFRMPDNFDRVIIGYNELQKRQGLDLSKYANKRVTRFSYRVTNYDSEGEVYANLFVHRGKIVACDLSSADPSGFVIPLTMVDRAKLK
ncbi:MAG: DUF4830 domain-containing protein [Clostridia bacterium]|nr:DUF4830 domain-containing protein [Clostridia bacterium]